MNEDVSPAVEKLAHTYVDGQRFSTSTDVLLFSLDLLGTLEKHCQDELGQSLASAFSAIDKGKGKQFNASRDLDAFFAEIMRRGRVDAS